jgi:hypothetical protein
MAEWPTSKDAAAGQAFRQMTVNGAPSTRFLSLNTSNMFHTYTDYYFEAAHNVVVDICGLVVRIPMQPQSSDGRWQRRRNERLLVQHDPASVTLRTCIISLILGPLNIVNLVHRFVPNHRDAAMVERTIFHARCHPWWPQNRPASWPLLV